MNSYALSVSAASVLLVQISAASGYDQKSALSPFANPQFNRLRSAVGQFSLRDVGA
jgi:hypothetical protein